MMTAREQAARLHGGRSQDRSQGQPGPGGRAGAVTTPGSADTDVLRIERGSLTDEELAALTAVLLARLVGERRPSAPPAVRRVTPSRSDYRSPVSWQQAA